MEVLAVIKHFMLDSSQQVKFHRHMKRIDNLDRGQEGVLDSIDELYQLFPDKNSLTTAELKAYIKKKNPSRDIEYVSAIIDSAMDQKIGKEVSQMLIEAVIERHMATKAMAIASPVVSNQKTGDWAIQTEAVLQEYYDLVGMADRADQLQDCDMSFQEAIEFRATDSGIKWPINPLNKAIGGVEPSLGLVIARPDCGKTSFILNCLAYFAAQLRGTDHQLLYCGNEEGIIGLKARFGVSLLGVESEWAEQNPQAFGQQVEQRNGSCVRFHSGVRSTRDVETLIKRYNPLVTVADQIAKFKIPGNTEEGPKALASVYSWFRNASQDFSTMVMAVAQADVKAGQWVTMDNINGSKTDVPGELDWGIGIGMLDEPGMETTRFFNIFKNKMKYGRKGRGQVSFFPEKCRYKD
jgi:replicative DNA helicase